MITEPKTEACVNRILCNTLCCKLLSHYWESTCCYQGQNSIQLTGTYKLYVAECHYNNYLIKMIWNFYKHVTLTSG